LGARQKGHKACYDRIRGEAVLKNVASIESPPARTPDSPEVASLRASLGRALRSLDDSKRKTADLVAASEQAARDAVAALHIPPVPKPVHDGGKRTAEVAVCVLADWQLGKKTPTYSTEACEKRIEAYAEKVLGLAAIQRAHHPVREARVYLLGDLVEGELIFPGQAHRIDASLFRQVVTDGPRILAGLLRRLASDFEKVHVVGVIGNHGRLGGRSAGDYHPETNADAMMYEITRLVVAGEPRISWAPNVVEGERRWYAVDRIGDKGFLLFHGDQVKGGMLGFPWYGFGKKILGWANGGIPEPFDYAVSGHFHTPVRGLYGRVRHWGSGSTESDNTYAQEFFSATGQPSQWLLFAHPRHGVTAEFEVHL
jgi:hypothetical protein